MSARLSMNDKIAIVAEAIKKNANDSILIYKLSTGSYVYFAKAVVIRGKITYSVEKYTTLSEYIASSEVHVSFYGIEYNNNGGNLTIPASISKKLIEFNKEIYFKGII